MVEEDFYRDFRAMLREVQPVKELPAPDPDTHLWQAGYLDSLAMLEVVTRLEGLVGRQLPLTGDFLPTFFTMRTIFDTYVAPATGG